MSTESPSRTARLRKALGLTQSEFADRLGVSQSTLSRLELGQPETGPVARLLDILGANTGEIASSGAPSAARTPHACHT